MMKLLLLQQFTPKVVFDRNKKFNPEKTAPNELNININFDISVTFKPVPNAKHEYLLDLQLGWHDIKSPVVLDIITCGIFRITGVDKDAFIDKEALDKLMRIEGADTLLPYLRERVSNLTFNGGLPPLILPPIDFSEIQNMNIKQPTLQ